MRGECMGKGENFIYEKYFCGMNLRKVFLWFNHKTKYAKTA